MRGSGWSTGVVGAYSPFILHPAHREDGRHEAQRRALTMTATLGVLERAAVRGLIDLPPCAGATADRDISHPA